ncbi:MAG TPA: hypothetical protein VGE94_04955 [Chloroflexota bacterium]|jgi:hypothetical protein
MNFRLRLRPVAATLASVSLLAVLGAQSAFADQRDFTLNNNSSIPLKSVYVSAADVQSWEEDILGRDILDSGASVDVSFGKAIEGTCLYDIKVAGFEGQSGVLYAVDLCTVTNVTFNDAA